MVPERFERDDERLVGAKAALFKSALARLLYRIEESVRTECRVYSSRRRPALERRPDLVAQLHPVQFRRHVHVG